MEGVEVRACLHVKEKIIYYRNEKFVQTLTKNSCNQYQNETNSCGFNNELTTIIKFQSSRTRSHDCSGLTD